MRTFSDSYSQECCSAAPRSLSGGAGSRSLFGRTSPSGAICAGPGLSGERSTRRPLCPRTCGGSMVLSTDQISGLIARAPRLDAPSAGASAGRSTASAQTRSASISLPEDRQRRCLLDADADLHRGCAALAHPAPVFIRSNWSGAALTAWWTRSLNIASNMAEINIVATVPAIFRGTTSLQQNRDTPRNNRQDFSLFSPIIESCTAMS